MTRVAIIVLNWNGIDDTIKCVKSLNTQIVDSDYAILVIDNGSTDDSKDILKVLKNRHKKINLIFNRFNLGFAGGVNIGIKWAIENKYDFVALFNNDATAEKNWLENLLVIMTDNAIGITTGLLLREDGKTIDSTGEQYSKWGLPFPRDRNKTTTQRINSGLTFGATGGASLYRIDMIKEIGLFDEDFFAYYEDTDISFRAQLAGWKVKYTNKAVAYHKQGATSNKISGFAIYQTFKNLPLLFLKNVPRKLLLPIGIRFILGYKLMLFNAIVKGNGKSALKGFWDGFKLYPKKINERKYIQATKKVSADDIKIILWNDLPPNQTGLRKFRKIFTGRD